MPNINEARRRFWLALGILLAVCLAATAVLLSPIGSLSRHPQEELSRLHAELEAKTLETAPLHGIDRKVIAARRQIATFYQERLPSSYASISETLGALASDNGVSLTTGHYKAEPSSLPGLQHLVIEAAITGNYPRVIRFLNAVEREKTFFLINDVSLKQQQGGVLQVQVRIEAFLKEAGTTGLGSREDAP